MARLKSEYLFQVRSVSSYIRSWHIKNLGNILKIGSKMPDVFNFLQCSYLSKRFIRFEKQPPLLQRESLSQWWGKEKLKKDGCSTTVWVLADIFTQYYDVKSGKNMLNFLNKCNVNVDIIFSKKSVLAMVSHGLLNEAKQEIESLSFRLNKINKNDLIVGIEPSEILVWRDDAISLVGNKTPNILLFEELILKFRQLDVLPKLNALSDKVWIYEHCHQKSLVETSNIIEALAVIPEIQTEIINGGCCGMAGEFGYKHVKISEKIAHNSLDKFMKKIEKNDRFVATGLSCRRQILDVFKIQTLCLPQLFLESAKPIKRS